MKLSNILQYINVNRNHPPNIINNIPGNISKRLSSLSKNEIVFKEAIPPYQKALEDSGYTYKLHFNPTNPPADNLRNRTRQRNVTWYNPPFCKSLKTNLGKKFFKILDQCFPKESKMSKIFNHNTVKLSFSCMPNIGRIISSHNKALKDTPPQVPPCNCTLEECPVGGECQRENIIYQCKVTEELSKESESYIGLTSRTFKDRVTKHKKSFRDRQYHKSSLSKHIWNLKDQNKEFKIAWKILDKAQPYSPATKVCNLCVRECFYIMYQRNLSSLNKRDEFFGFCLHKSKFLIANQ